MMETQVGDEKHLAAYNAERLELSTTNGDWLLICLIFKDHCWPDHTHTFKHTQQFAAATE